MKHISLVGVFFFVALGVVACSAGDDNVKMSDYETVINRDDVYKVPQKPTRFGVEWADSTIDYLYGFVWAEEATVVGVTEITLQPHISFSTDDYRYKYLPDGIVSLGEEETTEQVMVKLSEPNGSWRIMPNLPYGWPADVPAPTHSWIFIENADRNGDKMVSNNFASTKFGGNKKLINLLKDSYIGEGWELTSDLIGTFSNGLEGREVIFMKGDTTVRIAGFLDVFKDSVSRQIQDPFVSITVLSK